MTLVEELWYRSYRHGDPPKCARLIRRPMREQWEAAIRIVQEPDAGYRTVRMGPNLESYLYWPHSDSPTWWWLVPPRIFKRTAVLIELAERQALCWRGEGCTRNDVQTVLRGLLRTRAWRRWLARGFVRVSKPPQNLDWGQLSRASAAKRWATWRRPLPGPTPPRRTPFDGELRAGRIHQMRRLARRRAIRLILQHGPRVMEWADWMRRYRVPGPVLEKLRATRFRRAAHHWNRAEADRLLATIPEGWHVEGEVGSRVLHQYGSGIVWDESEHDAYALRELLAPLDNAVPDPFALEAV